MATSGSYDWNLTRDDICRAALRICGALDPGETAAASDINTTAEALNHVIKSWNNTLTGFQLYAQQRATVFLSLNKRRYRLGSSGDPATSSYAETTIASTANTGAKTIICAASGISYGSKGGAGIGATSASFSAIPSSGYPTGAWVGFRLGDGTMQWTTLSATISPSGTAQLSQSLSQTVTLSNPVYLFNTKIARPVSIAEAWIRDSTNYDYSLSAMTRNEFHAIRDKTRDGRPTAYYYHPFDGERDTGQLNAGTIYLDWDPDNVTQSLEIVYRRQLQDFDIGTDNPDLPPEHLRALKWILASEIAPEFGVPLAQQDRLRETAAQMMLEMRAMHGDMPRASVPWSF